MSNIQKFKRFLDGREIRYELIDLENGSKGFRLLQSLENGPNLIIGVTFNDREDLVDIRIYNIAKITNPLKKPHYHSLLNDLNDAYRFTKFTESENEIMASYSFELVGTNDFSKFIMDSVVMVYNSVETEFPKFMKLQWA